MGFSKDIFTFCLMGDNTPPTAHHLQPDLTVETTLEGPSLKGRGQPGLGSGKTELTGLICYPKKQVPEQSSSAASTKPPDLVGVSLPIFSQKLPSPGLYPGVSCKQGSN